MRWLFLVASILVQIGLSSVPADAGQRVALVFGNSDYQNAPRLTNPVNDASDVAAAFERLGFSVRLIENGTYDTMRRGLRDFAEQAQGADVAVVYFAGHGIEIRDENWLIPVDAELHTDVSASEEAIGLTSLMPIVSSARKLGLVILDSCRDNPFGRQMLMSQSSRTLSARGLVAVEPPNSVLVVFAAKHGTTAEDGAGRNSPFTSALLRNLEVPGLEINYLFRNIHDDVYNATQQHQEPYVYGTLSREPIYLKPAANSAVASLIPPQPVTQPAVVQPPVAQQPAIQQPEMQAVTPPPAPAAAPPAAAPLPPNLAAMAGHWTWHADCALLFYDGTQEQEVYPDGRYVAHRSDGETVEGRVTGTSVTGVHKVDGGIQRGVSKLTIAANGHNRLEGTFTDSRLPFGSCRYRAVRS
jgi:Caspase domain